MKRVFRRIKDSKVLPGSRNLMYSPSLFAHPFVKFSVTIYCFIVMYHKEKFEAKSKLTEHAEKSYNVIIIYKSFTTFVIKTKSKVYTIKSAQIAVLELTRFHSSNFCSFELNISVRLKLLSQRVSKIDNVVFVS